MNILKVYNIKTITKLIDQTHTNKQIIKKTQEKIRTNTNQKYTISNKKKITNNNKSKSKKKK